MVVSDARRRSFLDALDESDESVSDYEAKFIESTLNQDWFTPKQRDVVDRMIKKYGGKLSW